MSKLREFAHLLITFLIVGGIIAVLWVVTDSLGAWDTLRAQQQTRAAEARARELEAQALVLRERQAIIMTRAMTLASTKDTLLVTLTYIGGGVALLSMLIIIGLLLLDERRRNYERDL